MSIHLLWTSADSLIVAFALAFIVPQRHVLPLILMFGACDALGSALGVTMPVAGGLAAILLIACGASLVVRHPIAQRLLNAPGWFYVLPPLLAIDNLVSRTSAMMAGLGFACGAAVSRGWRAGLRDVRPLAAACLIAAGSLIAYGA
ncbi:hypothetical protein ABIF66_001067 [Bradyrhizobium japonicum]